MVPSVKVGQLIPNYPLKVTYKVTKHDHKKRTRGALVDRGANGGIIGSDARVILQHQRTVDITGIDNHEMNALKIVDASSKVISDKGPIILIMKQYAYHGVGKTIHSSGQIESYKHLVEDRSQKVGGRQCIRLHDGYIIPIDIICGLPYIKMSPNTDDEWNELPHVILTSGDSWDPKVLDNIISDRDDWKNMLKDLDQGLIKSPFDQYGNYRERQPTPEVTVLPQIEEPTEATCHDFGARQFREVFRAATNVNVAYIPHDDVPRSLHVLDVKTRPIDHSKFRHLFLNAPVHKVKKTFENSTQDATNIMSGHIVQQTIKSPFPAHNVWRRNEPVATDTVYAEVPAVDSGGQTMAQIFVGRKSLVIDVYGMSNSDQFVNTLEDNIRKRGAMDKLISDSAHVEISQRVQDIL